MKTINKKTQATIKGGHYKRTWKGSGSTPVIEDNSGRKAGEVSLVPQTTWTL